jgi:hypothetical protein
MDTIQIMENIGICIYSYQNKNLFKTVSEIIDKSSQKNMLYFYIIDQNSVDRTRSLDQPDFYASIVYKYVTWDSIKSPIEYKRDAFKSLNKKYYMQIGDDVSLAKDWDIHAVEFLKNNKNSILSGNSTVTLKNKNWFMLEPERVPSANFNKINYIDRNFIFALSEDFSIINQPTHLKYCGEEESISIDLINSGVDIYNFPDEYISINKNSVEDKYTPFSVTHNYNQFIEKYSNEIQKNFNINLIQLPFEDNDVAYDTGQSQIDRMGGLRYLDRIKEIR